METLGYCVLGLLAIVLVFLLVKWLLGPQPVPVSEEIMMSEELEQIDARRRALERD